jgi:hypothetical protein
LREGPSCLDYAASDVSIESALTWDRCHSDHAILSVIAPGFFIRPTHEPSTWRVHDEGTAIDWIYNNDMRNISAETFVNWAHIFMDETRDQRSRGERRKNHEPFQLSDLYSRASRAKDAVARRVLLRRASAVRLDIYRRSALTALRANLRDNKAVKPVTKLHTIRQMVMSERCMGQARAGKLTRDRNDWVEEVTCKFNDKWGGDAAHIRTDLVEKVRSLSDANLDISVADINHAFDKLKCTRKLDSMGLTTSALRLIARASPELVASTVQEILGSEELLKQLWINGRVQGKESSSPSADEVRAILPLPALLQIGDLIISEKLEKAIVAVLPQKPGVYHGSDKHTQTLEIGFSVAKLLEKGNDDFGNAAVAETDVASFYDSIALQPILEWCTAHNIPRCLVGPALRMQSFVPVRLQCGNLWATPNERSLGVLTGTRIAGVLGKIPIRETIQALRPELDKLGFATPRVTLTVATWVDNLISVAASAERALRMQVLIESYLCEKWGLRIKERSRTFMTPKSGDSVDAPPWKAVHVMRTLGHYNASNSSIARPWAIVHGHVMSAFYAKYRPTMLRGCSGRELAQLVDKHLWPIVAFRAAGWPHQPVVAKQMDKLQTRLVSMLLPLRCAPEETYKDFCKRRGQTATKECDAVARWSWRWAALVIGWDAHVNRNSSGLIWASFLREVRDKQWLMKQRGKFTPTLSSNPRAWTVFAGRTSTRQHRGGVPMRWHLGMENAVELERSVRSNSAIKRMYQTRERRAIPPRIDAELPQSILERLENGALVQITVPV